MALDTGNDVARASATTDGAGYRVAAIGAAAYALCDTLHELGHVAATWLPDQGSVVSVASVGIGTTTRSPAVALAGPLVNLLLAGALAVSMQARLPPNWRYASWLFGTLNLFNGFAYLVYSAVLGSGDWATVFDALGRPAVWRPMVAVSGVALYGAAVHVSSRAARALVVAGVVTRRQITRDCLLVYWAGGALLVLASVLNPISPLLILTSGVATGFGAMAGLVLLPALLKGASTADGPAAAPAAFGTAWVVGGVLLSLAFVLVLGRGWRVAPDAAPSRSAWAQSERAEGAHGRGVPDRRIETALRGQEI